MFQPSPAWGPGWLGVCFLHHHRAFHTRIIGQHARRILDGALDDTASCRRWTLCPGLRSLAALACRASECDDFGHFPAHFSLDDFSQGNVRGAEIGNVGDERPAGASSARI